jgi:hypothetical protein
MKPQTYANHSRYVGGFHFLLSSLLLIGFIVSIVNLFMHWNENGLMFSLFVLLYFCGLLLFWYSRRFAVRAQDRAIRGEESLRYFIMTGKAIDSRITMSQIIALRFADDEEFVALADKAAAESMWMSDIKKAIKKWRADHHRA